MPALEFMIRCLACGALIALAAGFARGGIRNAMCLAGTLFSLSAASFAVHSGGSETQTLGPLLPIVWFLSAGGAGYFWLFAVTIFSDRRMSTGHMVPPAALTAGAAIASVSVPPYQSGLWIAHNILEAAFVVHALTVIWSGWSEDLVEGRRELRGPFLAVVGLLALALSAEEVAFYLSWNLSWASLTEAVSLLVAGIAAIHVFLTPGPGLMAVGNQGPAVRVAVPPDIRDAPALLTLNSLMRDRQAWRREGLTIASLAQEVGVPEHRLRTIINQGLGFRNFADYMSSFRIEAAKVALADPARANMNISTIAFELGYASLGPFNRAFRDATGTTPSAFRAASLAGSPNLENPR